MRDVPLALALAALFFITYVILFVGDDAMERCQSRFSHSTCVELIR